MIMGRVDRRRDCPLTTPVQHHRRHPWFLPHVQTQTTETLAVHSLARSVVQPCSEYLSSAQSLANRASPTGQPSSSTACASGSPTAQLFLLSETVRMVFRTSPKGSAQISSGECSFKTRVMHHELAVNNRFLPSLLAPCTSLYARLSSSWSCSLYLCGWQPLPETNTGP